MQTLHKIRRIVGQALIYISMAAIITGMIAQAVLIGIGMFQDAAGSIACSQAAMSCMVGCMVMLVPMMLGAALDD